MALGAINLHGRFERLSGWAWRRGEGESIEVLVEVEAGSLTMASARYQAWARSPEFFDVQRHPRVVFRSQPLSLSLFEGGGALAGWLTVRDIERPVAFRLRDPGCADPDLPCVLNVEGEIRRAEFGMRSRRMTLSDRVALDQQLTVVPDPGSCPVPAGRSGPPPGPSVDSRGGGLAWVFRKAATAVAGLGAVALSASVDRIDAGSTVPSLSTGPRHALRYGLDGLAMRPPEASGPFVDPAPLTPDFGWE